MDVHLVLLANLNRSFKRIGYLRFGKYADPLINRGGPWLDSLKRDILQAGWEISLRGYLGMAIFGAILSVFGSILIGIILAITSLMLLEDPILSGLIIILSIFISIITAGLFFWSFTFWPRTKTRARRIEIDNALPTVSSYMSAMTSSGVPPAAVFASLAKEEISPIITHEASRINRDIEIMGLDVLKALEQAAYRSPSERWSGFLEGVIATVTSGGALTTYLTTETKLFMKLKQEETKEFIEELGVMAEIFMVLGVVAPLFFVVMVAILSILSDAGSGSILFLVTITYIIIPFLMVVVMILLDTTNVSLDA